MTKKILIFGIVISCLFFFSAGSPVLAADELEILEDPEDDVYVLDEESLETVEDFSDLETTGDKPNVDIVKVTYSKEEQSTNATMSLEVKGIIEDSGIDESFLEDLDDWSELLQPIVMYTINLETSNSTYVISYMNELCTVNDDNATYTKDGSTLTVTFDLGSADETFVSMQAISMEMDLSTFLTYSDYAPDLVILEVTADGPTKGKTGKTITFTGSASEGTSPYEYEWDFGDGNSSTDQNPTHSYSKDGTYTVILMVYDADGNAGYESFEIEISQSITGGNGDNGSGGGSLAFIALILVVVIAGVAVLFYVLKR